MSLEKFANIYKENGFEINVDNKNINIVYDKIDINVSIDDDWVKSINEFFKAKQYTYISENRVLIGYRFAEFQILQLDTGFMVRPEYIYSDSKGNKVKINSASREFVLSMACAKPSDQYFNIIRNRLNRRIERHREKAIRLRFWFEDLLLIPHTARFEVSRKQDAEKLLDLARKRIKATLFKIAYSNNECWELKEYIKSNIFMSTKSSLEANTLIPNAVYNDDIVSYYKLAKASQFANQAFLSYYNILEYFFLRVSDMEILDKVRSHINSLDFVTDYKNINKLISIVKKHDISSDETEMLKSVLNKYINEDELICYINEIETDAGKKIYSENKKFIFGEKLSIRLDKGHAISNSAKVIKHIRNSLVHSSDKYSREECYLPFSESESIVHEYLPLIKYMVERVIFSTAE